ncbi:PLP-dependent aminotransferase family protein [uncultured Desulfuromusa sp.]|uniref:aminotransferase-like domain-containing protein n=1 Tax=uncultured Desulfuromusa sp. TaxID=219183 RepID=UPI002AA83A03|nr:PLP-dependent aminotransferase family protein [uncultured Desulfuromusa sp.]
MTIWKPELKDGKGPKYRQIADAISEAVEAGILNPGTRLTPHRILAYELGISPNTTSRAYAECVNRGLLYGETGRGTFVKIPRKDLDRSQGLGRAQGPVDFSRNLPFPGPGAAHLASTLSQLGASHDLQVFLDYQTGDGHLKHHLEAGKNWLNRTGVKASNEEIVITNGAQHGIFTTLMSVTCPGDTIVTEKLTYSPIRLMAKRLGLKLRTVEMDDEGLNPDALDRACSASQVKVVYLTPTIQTPTTITMGEDRRKAIAALARRHNLILIEDDVYGPLRPELVVPLVELAPERTIYMSSCSKCLAPGLRVAFLRAPDTMVRSLRQAVALSCWMVPPLMSEVASRWIVDGTASLLTEAQRSNAAERQVAAKKILDGYIFRADPHGFHLWLTLPSHWQSDIFCREAERRGVILSSGHIFAPDNRFDPGAVRINLSHEPDQNRVMAGLEVLAELLKEEDRQGVMVL